MRYNIAFLWALCAHGEMFPETGARDFFDAYCAGGEI